jgi:hypothetical protein
MIYNVSNHSFLIYLSYAGDYATTGIMWAAYNLFKHDLSLYAASSADIFI